MHLTQELKNRAYRLGFSLVGVTTSAGLAHREAFEAWLESGRHGQMSYLASLRSRQCRADPRQILPECRSVIVLGLRYPKPGSVKPDSGDKGRLYGRIAAYAWGEDYHNFILPRLDDLVRFIELQVGHPVLNRCYTDTGPILERELAMRAGLGWIGKNTCLINPSQGSYFLLSEILLDLELEPDLPFTKDRCGTCTRCLQACPTGCILPDRTIDARRCISYLTIELKGTIPPELRPLMGDWVFGCDICQQVCPWNHFAGAEIDPAFNPLMVNPTPDLLEEISLSPGDFSRKYRHTPLQRAKHRGYLRNVAVALGNAHAQSVTPTLSQALLEEIEPLIRVHIAWALGQTGGSLAKDALEKALELELDPQVRVEIEAALVKLGQENVSLDSTDV